MSKTLFNQNTFQSKNVTNSDDVTDLKVDTFKAINLTATNITNTELQAATSLSQLNNAGLGNKQNTLSATTLLNPNFISAENDGSAVIITTGEFGALTGFDNTGGATIQGEIDKKAQLYDVSTPLVKTVRDPVNLGENPILLSINKTTAPLDGSEALITAGGVFTALSSKQNTMSSGSDFQIEVADNEVTAILATSAGSSNYGLITGNILNTELNDKQDVVTATNGIQINSNVLSLTGDYSGSFGIGGTDFKIWNDARGGTGTSNGRALVHHYIGTEGSKETSVLRINYNSDFGAGTKIDSITGIKTNPDTNYDLKVNGNTDIGGTLSINGYSNVKNALDAAGGGLVYAALANGGLAVAANGSGVNEFSIDLTNSNSTFSIPQDVHIEVDGVPQLLVEPASVNSEDAEIEIRGARTGSTTNGQAKLVFANYDHDITTTNILGRIDGRVSNDTTNIGGLLFSTYADGSTRTGQLSLSAAGNLGLGNGDTFQDDYKMKVTGSVNLNGANYIKQQLALFGYDKSTIGGSNWGNGSTQTSIISDRRSGDSFCSTSSGVITLSKNGMYRIRVSAQTQSDGYNDRVSFLNYLRINSTDYDEVQNRNFFGWVYLRNNSDAAHGSTSFEDYIYLTSGSTIQPRQKLETGGNRNFDNTLTAAQIDNYLNIQIERLYDTNPLTGS
mgnify:FL=1